MKLPSGEKLAPQCSPENVEIETQAGRLKRVCRPAPDPQARHDHGGEQ